MERRKKRSVAITQDSALEIMQEIYNEIAENRATALLIQKKMLAFMKDSDDLTVIGPIIKDQQKILNDTVDKKLQLSKLQTSMLQKKGDNGTKKVTLSGTDRDLLEQILNNDEKKS